MTVSFMCHVEDIKDISDWIIAVGARCQVYGGEIGIIDIPLMGSMGKTSVAGRRAPFKLVFEDEDIALMFELKFAGKKNSPYVWIYRV